MLFKYSAGFSLRIGVAGEYSKETEGLLWKGKALKGNKQKWAREFNEVAGESSDLRCLMNTLIQRSTVLCWQSNSTTLRVRERCDFLRFHSGVQEPEFFSLLTWRYKSGTPDKHCFVAYTQTRVCLRLVNVLRMPGNGLFMIMFCVWATTSGCVKVKRTDDCSKW